VHFALNPCAVDPCEVHGGLRVDGPGHVIAAGLSRLKFGEQRGQVPALRDRRRQIGDFPIECLEFSASARQIAGARCGRQFPERAVDGRHDRGRL
jgi:hypothetical protein